MLKKALKKKKQTTAREKLEREHPSHGTIATGRKGESLLIPRPLDVDAAMRGVRKGRVQTMGELRARLARDAGAESACPLCTGIFARMAAEAAEEDRHAGRKRITPYWRTVRDNGSMNEKFPGGRQAQAAMLRTEGIRLNPGQGKKSPRVVAARSK
ncbi:MAG: hypothetical protein ACKVW3_16775 [Phycisphaerales bacterium]